MATMHLQSFHDRMTLLGVEMATYRQEIATEGAALVRQLEQHIAGRGRTSDAVWACE